MHIILFRLNLQTVTICLIWAWDWYKPCVLDVDVDEGGNGEGCQGVVPPCDDAEGKVEKDANHRQRPVIVFESRSPVGHLQNGLEDANQVDEKITHEEKSEMNSSKYTRL